MKSISVGVLAGLALSGWTALGAEPDLSKLPSASIQKEVTYTKDIRPLFEASCFRCHGEQRQRGELRLDSLEAVLKGGEDGKVIIPGKSKESPLLIAVAQIDPEKMMPPKPRQGGPGGNRGPGGPGGTNNPAGGNRPGGPGGGPGGPGGNRGPGGPPAKPLTSEQVGLVRAWIDQGAK